MKRYAVTFQDSFTSHLITMETMAFSERGARHNIYNDCGDVEIIRVVKVA